MEASYRSSHADNQLDAIETATLNAELNKVENSLNQMLGLASSTTFGASVTTNVDSSDATLADLKQRITRNLTTGRLTIDEARSLTNQYNHVVSDRNSFKADGTLSLDENNRLNQELDDLKRSIISNTHDSQVWQGIDGQQAAQAKRIDDGIAAGRVSRPEYEQLKAESNRIANQEAAARANGLQLEETLALATSLKDLDQRITVSLNNSTGIGSNFGGNPYQGGWSRDREGMADRDGHDFDMRQSYVLKRIDEATANGRLDAAEAAYLRDDYTRLEQLEASYRADGRLSPTELNVLQQGLESLTTELKEKSASIAVQYPEIDRKQTELKAKIDQGVSSFKIRRIDGQKLSASLAWIASVEAAFRQSGGTLDKAEADRILADLDRLNAKIDRSSSNSLQDLITRKNDLQRKIDENSASGKLSYRTARNLRRDLDRIGFSLAAYSPTATIPTADIVRITAEMDRLNTGITSGLTYGGDYRSGGRGDWNQR
jgi:hypothetical protein